MREESLRVIRPSKICTPRDRPNVHRQKPHQFIGNRFVLGYTSEPTEQVYRADAVCWSPLGVISYGFEHRDPLVNGQRSSSAHG